MKFHPRRRVNGRAECVAPLGIAEAQPRLLVVFDAAEVGSHDEGKERIDEIKNAFAAAEVVGERNGLGASRVYCWFATVMNRGRGRERGRGRGLIVLRGRP